MPNDILKHVGILGMKWGVHRGGSGSNSGGSGRDLLGRSRGSADHQVVRKIKRKRVKDMSNEELKTLVTRMSLEKQYRDLKSGTGVARGSKFMSDFAKGTGQSLASKYISKGIDSGAPKLAAFIMKKYNSGG